MRVRYLLVLILLLGLFLSPALWPAQAQSLKGLARVEDAVVQIIAADEGRGGELVPRWSGSGVLISADGLILTSCQVAMPRLLWDDPAFDYGLLVVALATKAGKPPQATYLAEVVQQDAALDLAVLRITQTLDGSPVDAGKLRLPALPLGDSDALAAGDALTIFGYAGAPGEPVGSLNSTVVGFSSGRGIKGRAWIRMDADIEGGYSGGPAVSQDGKLVGIVAAGTVTKADEVLQCRYDKDTNGDGLIDQNDTCSPMGGAIRTLRPANLSRTLIEAAKRNLGPNPTPAAPAPEPTRQPTPAKAPKPVFSKITFAEGVDRKGNPVRPGTTFKSGISEFYAFYDYEGMQDGWEFTVHWYIDGELVVDASSPWEGGESGENFWSRIYSKRGALPEGEYELELLVEGEPVQSGTCTIAGKEPRPTPTPRPPKGDVEIYGRITDAETGRGIAGAYFVVLQPGITVADFEGDKNDIYTLAETDRKGNYELPDPLVRGETYSIIIVAEGYQPIAEDDVYVDEDVKSPVEVNVKLTRAK